MLFRSRRTPKENTTITSLPSSDPVIPLVDVVGDVAAALAIGDRYRRYVPVWQWGRLRFEGERVGNKERQV